MVSDSDESLLVLILLHHIKEEVETEENGNYHIFGFSGGTWIDIESHIKHGCEARVSNNDDNGSVKYSLPPALLRYNELLWLHKVLYVLEEADLLLLLFLLLFWIILVGHLSALIFDVLLEEELGSF